MLIASVSLIAHLYVQSQVYYPVVHISAPDGLDIAVVLAETTLRTTCGHANDRFLEPLKESCKGCRIVTARCERELEGIDLALRQGAPLPYPTVIASDARVAFIGPADIAKISCDAAAATVAAKGFKSAACIPAQKPRPPRT